MKYILSIFAILISLMHVPDTYCATRYAQVMDETYLYRSSSTEHSATNIVCIMERSYFCTILVDYDANLFKVSYAGFEGYAKKADLKEVTTHPKVATPLGITIDVNLSCFLRSSPVVASDNILCKVYENAPNVVFVARAYGDVAMDMYGPVWYLVSYGNATGYIYSGYTKGLGPIMPSSEKVSYLEPIIDDRILPLPATYCIILLVIILLPMSVIFFFLYKPYKKHKLK